MYQLYRCLNKLAKILNISVLYQTKTGVKSLNQLMQSRETPALSEFYAKPQELFLGFDALKDAYSLVDVCIDASPHLGLMQALDEHRNVKQTDYCRRYAAGTLDGRSRVALSSHMLRTFEDKFADRRQEIVEECYAPVQVYKCHGRYYIADGKHRAALCVLLDKPIKCAEISDDFLQDSFRQWIYRKMLKNKKAYSKNLSLFED